MFHRSERLVTGATENAGEGSFGLRSALFALAKKGEFLGIMLACCLGTPFPRSALFLVLLCRNFNITTRVQKDDMF